MIVGELVGSGIQRSRNPRGVVFHDANEQDLIPSTGSWAKDFNLKTLIDMLSNEDDGVRSMAVHYLAILGEEAKAAEPKLRELLHDENKSLRIEAAFALHMIGADTNEAVPILIELASTSGGDKDIQLNVALVLSVLARKSKDIAQRVMDLLGDQSGILMHEATLALHFAGYLKEGQETESEIAPHLITLFEHESPRVRFQATSLWAMIAPKTGREIAIPLLRKMLQGSMSDIRGAAFALGFMGPDAKDAVPDLQSLLDRDPDEITEGYLTAAIERITEPDSQSSLDRNY